jgi:hypothetical protein
MSMTGSNTCCSTVQVCMNMPNLKDFKEWEYCTLCSYDTPIGGRERDVGGIAQVAQTIGSLHRTLLAQLKLKD